MSSSNTTESSQMGFLEIIMGPMYAGKTSYLIDLYHDKRESNKEYEIMVINHSRDTRYNSREVGLCSHNRQFIPCLWTNELFKMADIKNNDAGKQFLKAKFILINECQFFNDIVEWVVLAVEKYHKQVYICGLDCDFKRNLFGNWLDLIKYADNVVKLKAICACCRRQNALYSHRLTDSKEQVLIGHSEHEPLCRKCYLNKNMKTT